MGPQLHPARRFRTNGRKTDLRLWRKAKEIQKNIPHTPVEFCLGEMPGVAPSAVRSPPNLVPRHLCEVHACDLNVQALSPTEGRKALQIAKPTQMMIERIANMASPCLIDLLAGFVPAAFAFVLPFNLPEHGGSPWPLIRAFLRELAVLRSECELLRATGRPPMDAASIVPAGLDATLQTLTADLLDDVA